MNKEKIPFFNMLPSMVNIGKSGNEEQLKEQIIQWSKQLVAELKKQDKELGELEEIERLKNQIAKLKSPAIIEGHIREIINQLTISVNFSVLSTNLDRALSDELRKMIEVSLKDVAGRAKKFIQIKEVSLSSKSKQHPITVTIKANRNEYNNAIDITMEGEYAKKLPPNKKLTGYTSVPIDTKQIQALQERLAELMGKPAASSPAREDIIIVKSPLEKIKTGSSPISAEVIVAFEINTAFFAKGKFRFTQQEFDLLRDEYYKRDSSFSINDINEGLRQLIKKGVIKKEKDNYEITDMKYMGLCYLQLATKRIGRAIELMEFEDYPQADMDKVIADNIAEAIGLSKVISDKSMLSEILQSFKDWFESEYNTTDVNRYGVRDYRGPHIAKLIQPSYWQIVENISSSPLATPPETPGGIDFRSMNIIAQPMGSFANLKLWLPLVANIDGFDLNKEIAEIKQMVESGIIPSEQRLKELVAVCYQKKELNERSGDLIACLAAICKLEEERVSETPDGIKEVLLIVDSNIPAA